MFTQLVQKALDARVVVLLLAAVLCVLGWRAFEKLPIDAFPDITTTQVQVIVKAPGMTPEEVETRVTAPLEIEIRGIPNQTILRSITKYALAVITIDFTDDTDVYWARQQVTERIAQVMAGLPAGVEGGLAPITTPLSDAYMFLVESDQRDNRELRTILDWQIRPRLLSVPGVADINTLGGEVRTILVEPQPEALAAYGLTYEDVAMAIERNNANAGGGNVNREDTTFLLTTDARLRDLQDVAAIPVASRDGQSITVSDIADVRVSALPRFGAVTADGQGEAVQGIVLTRRGANTRETVQLVKERLAEISPTLPEDVRIVPFYDRADLIQTATSGVTSALIQGVVLVLIVLALFLFNVRSAVTAGLILPITVLGTFFVMQSAGLTANLMSLGGIAIAIGILVDSAVVMVENIDVKLRTSTREHAATALRKAASEMAGPIIVGVVIILISLAPILTLTGLEGKLFGPLALTIGISLVVSLLLSLTVIPVVASFLMRPGSHRESPLTRALLAIYRPLLDLCMRRRKIAAGVALGLLVLAGIVVLLTGREFMPRLEEGTIVLQFEKIPSISLERSLEIDNAIAGELMQLPEIDGVIARVGSDELRLDPMGVNETDCFLVTKPPGQWPDPNPAALEKKIRDILDRYPGIITTFTQPIDMRVSEMISGVTSAVAIRLIGSDLDRLESLSQQIENITAATPGAVDVARTPLSGQHYFTVKLRHEALSRTGLPADAINELMSRAVAGETVTEIIDGVMRVPVLMRFAEGRRSDPSSLGGLTLRSPGGQDIALADLADIVEEDGPSAINRTGGERVVVVEANVEGRDVVGFVTDLSKRLRAEIDLPPGFRIEFGGQFENEARAGARLALVVPVSLAVIFFILYTTFGNLHQAGLILLNIPFALIGGVFALWIGGYYISVPASLGFVALLGMAVMNGVVLVSYLNQLLEEGVENPEEAARTGAERRFRPVMMTSVLTIIGLVPLLLASGPGSEIQKPLAVVVVGGTLTSTALTLLLLPALYASIETWLGRLTRRR